MTGPVAVEAAACVPPGPPAGLSGAEVAARVARGQVNVAAEPPSRTVAGIVRANVVTRFNALLGGLLVVILVVGPLQDALFGVVLVANTLIGIVQELRAKRTLDRLALLAAPTARVVRDGVAHDIAVDDVVLDDVVELSAGDEVVCDGVVVAADGLELDESLLTGESDPVPKAAGDEVLSGSFAVAGTGWFRATRVGPDAYARRLAGEARRFTLVRSELRAGIDRILRYVTWAILPTASLLVASQFVAHASVAHALAGAVAGIVAMVPEGLVLLTSVAFAVSVVTLGRRHVLVQELPAVEGLARVDVVCLDKTGTLTEGPVRFDHLEPLGGPAPLAEALGALASGPRPNATLAAVAAAFPAPGWQPSVTVPFSSARKWSGATYPGRGSWLLGAPEILLERVGDPAAIHARLRDLTSAGRRVVLLATTPEPLRVDELPRRVRPAALVVLGEQIRADAADTVRYFLDQGMAVKVISGDNPATVAAIAERVGVPGAADSIDARHLPDDPAALAQVMDGHAVFGRVQPHQKRAMVAALQASGHVVAMTGDGVNDVLALKDADIGVAMGSGAAATKAVANLVLLDGRFATLPGVVAEGRRVIANIERVANLFVTKTVYAGLLAVAIGAARWPFPFLPRQLTLIGSLTIGIPAFFLSLAPNVRRSQPGFVPRVLRFATPAGLVAAAATFAAYALARAGGVDLDQARTTATLVLVSIGLWILVILARPMTQWRRLLIGTMSGLGATAVLVPQARAFFALDFPSWAIVGQAALVAGSAVALIEAGWRVSRWRRHRAAR